MRDKRKDVADRQRKEGQLAQVMHRLSRNRVSMTGLVVILILIVLAILSPWIMPYDYTRMDMSNMYATPSWAHPFGCDELGRDIFSRALYGARASLSLGLLATLLLSLIHIFGIIGANGGTGKLKAALVMGWISLVLSVIGAIVSLSGDNGFINLSLIHI